MLATDGFDLIKVNFLPRDHRRIVTATRAQRRVAESAKPSSNCSSGSGGLTREAQGRDDPLRKANAWSK